MSSDSLKKKEKTRPEYVGIAVDADVGPILDRAAKQQKTTKNELVSTLIRWFEKLDKTSRALVLKQISGADEGLVALLVLHRCDPAFADIDDHLRRLLHKHGEDSATEAG